MVRWEDKGEIWAPPTEASESSCLLPILAAEPVRVVVLDCGGVTFADAAGAREVVQG